MRLLFFLGYSLTISFGYYFWYNVAAKTKRKMCESLAASFYFVWKSKKDTNSEFAEFFLRGNSVSSPRDGNSNKRKCEELRVA